MTTKQIKLDVSHLGRTSLGKHVVGALLAYEAQRAEELGWKRYIGVRTRKPLIAHGPQVTIKRTLARRVTTPGFEALVENGKPEMTYEWIALLHPKSFTKDELQVARDRLKQAGVKRLPKAA